MERHGDDYQHSFWIEFTTCIAVDVYQLIAFDLLVPLTILFKKLVSDAKDGDLRYSNNTHQHLGHYFHHIVPDDVLDQQFLMVHHFKLHLDGSCNGVCSSIRNFH